MQDCMSTNATTASSPRSHTAETGGQDSQSWFSVDRQIRGYMIRDSEVASLDYYEYMLMMLRSDSLLQHHLLNQSILHMRPAQVQGLAVAATMVTMADRDLDGALSLEEATRMFPAFDKTAFEQVHRLASAELEEGGACERFAVSAAMTKYVFGAGIFWDYMCTDINKQEITWLFPFGSESGSPGTGVFGFNQLETRPLRWMVTAEGGVGKVKAVKDLYGGS